MMKGIRIMLTSLKKKIRQHTNTNQRSLENNMKRKKQKKSQTILIMHKNRMI